MTTPHHPYRRSYCTPLNISALRRASGYTTHHPVAATLDTLLFALAYVIGLAWVLGYEAVRILGWSILAALCLCGVWALIVWLVMVGWLWAWSLNLAPAMSWR